MILGSDDILKKLNTLQTKIKVNFRNPELLKQALTHRSFINEVREAKPHHNEKLEFLGDAVLELLVTQKLYDEYPERSEGELTSFRAATVKTESLAESAAEISLGEYILMSRGEESTGGRRRPYILANTFEALIGAIYLDLGLSTANNFLEEFLFKKIPTIVEQRLDIDNKSRLQEISQDQLNITPVYEFVSAVGPDHNKTFTMAVYINGKKFGVGKGKSKQEAEQQAANDAVNNWESLIKDYQN